MPVVIQHSPKKRSGRRRKAAGRPDPEAELAQALHLVGIEGWEREHRGWHPERQWRFDFAWPTERVAVEVEGQTFGKRCSTSGCGKMLAGGRHTRGRGFEEDCRKYNEAARLGWRVLRVTSDMVRTGEALNAIESLIGKGKAAGTQRGLDIGDGPAW